MMFRFVTDENFDNRIIRGLLRLKPNLDIVRVQDAGLLGFDDPTILEWAFQQNRILLTHDVSTITKNAYNRINEEKGMAGVLEAKRTAPLQPVIESLMTIIECSNQEEYINQIVYLPF